MDKEVKQDVVSPQNRSKSPKPAPKVVNRAPWLSMSNGGTYTKNYDERGNLKNLFEKDMKVVKDLRKSSSNLIYDDNSYMNSIKTQPRKKTTTPTKAKQVKFKNEP